MISFEFQIQDPLGLHARVVGRLVKLTREYECDVSLSSPQGVSNGKDLMEVMRMGAAFGDMVRVTCKGPDEAAASDRLHAFLVEHLSD